MVIAISVICNACTAQVNPLPVAAVPIFFAADNKNIQYTGRINFNNPVKPRFWQPGVYIKAKFEGTYCSIIVNDEIPGGASHNYLEVVVDDTLLFRLKTKGTTDTITVAKNLQNGTHTIAVCKNTEAGIGYLEFVGFLCNQILPMPEKPIHKLEFIGNSITCGTGSDISEIPCGQGLWQDQHNAYLSYGPTVARTLNAQWQLSSVSGIGLIHSCCNMTVTMPQVFDKINMRDNKVGWNFKNYQPDAVTVCLGQNDGIQDSVIFCSAYVDFIKKLRSHYPTAQIVCLTSPMGDAQLTAAHKNYLTGIVDYLSKNGDNKVSKYFFSKRFHNGCGDHPDLAEHAEIAKELSAYLQTFLGW